MGLLLVDKLLLVADPVFVSILDKVGLFEDLLFDGSQFILQGSTVLVFIVVLAILSQFSVLSVESVNIELALLDLQMSLLDLTFLIADLLLFLLELDNQLLEFLLEVAILVSGVEVINLDSADFV